MNWFILLSFSPLSSPEVELYDYIKEEVGFRLSDRVFDIKKEFKNALDFGKS